MGDTVDDTGCPLENHNLRATLMSQQAAFLSAIRDNPDDDTPRLAFADWLTENGSPEHGEFIRIQAERARLPADDDRQSDLHARELRLLAAHTADWTSGPPVMRAGRFRRGFMEYVTGKAADLVAQLPEIASLAPVRELAISNLGAADGLGAALAALPAMAGVETIMVSDRAGDRAPAEQLVALFASPHLKRVRRLKLFCGECNAEVLDQIVSLPALQQLESLQINGGLTADEASAVLHKHRELPIREFRAHKGPYGSWAMSLNGLWALADSGHWRRLEVLNVGIQPNPEILQRLAEGLPYSKIHTLWLHQGASSGGGMWRYEPGSQNYGIAEFAAAESWGNLRDLRFEYIEFNRGELPVLLEAKPLAKLTRLSFFGGMLGPEQGQQLLQCKALSGLRVLDLCGNFMLQQGFAGPLAEAKHLTNLIDLRLIWTQGADPVAEAVASSPQFARLRNLEMANNFVTAKGMRALGESPHLKRLNRLRVFEHPVGPWERLLGPPSRDVFRMTPEATTALASGLPNLGCLEIYGYNFPGETAALLLAAGDAMWAPIEPRWVESEVARKTIIERADRMGWFPPLDEYQEEEEMFP
jgi:uncharacterized protein (TIGR02996 family)